MLLAYPRHHPAHPAAPSAPHGRDEHAGDPLCRASPQGNGAGEQAIDGVAWLRDDVDAPPGLPPLVLLVEGRLACMDTKVQSFVIIKLIRIKLQLLALFN